MMILDYIGNLFAGLFLCNAIPHLASGLRGERFPTPFAKPHGIGLSSAPVNFLWGFFNLVAGLVLWSGSGVVIGLNWGFILFLTGFMLIGFYTARHFESVRSGKKDKL